MLTVSCHRGFFYFSLFWLMGSVFRLMLSVVTLKIRRVRCQSNQLCRALRGTLMRLKKRKQAIAVNHVESIVNYLVSLWDKWPISLATWTDRGPPHCSWNAKAANTLTSWEVIAPVTISVSQFRVCILRRQHLKATYITTIKAVPIQRLLQMQPTISASFSLFLEDAPLLFFVASSTPRFFACPKKQKERGDIAWPRSSLLWAWAAEIVM